MNERVNNKAATRIGTGRREKVNGGSIVERASQRKREKEKMVFNGLIAEECCTEHYWQYCLWTGEIGRAHV